MGILNNLDLLSVGVAIAGIGILGFILYFNNPRSITNRTFLLLSVIVALWNLLNYYSILPIVMESLTVWILRLVILSGLWFAFYLFKLAYVFPYSEIKFFGWYKKVLVPIVFLTSILTLTPFVFKEAIIANDNQITGLVPGLGLPFYALVVLGLLLASVWVFIKKIRNAKKEERMQYRLVGLGFGLTFVLLIIFNFLLPAFTNNSSFVSLGALFIFPFIALTAYSIYSFKHSLFDVKAVSTAALTFALLVIIFFEVIFSTELSFILFKASEFVLVFVIGVSLMRGVIREILQRENQMELAVMARYIADPQLAFSQDVSDES